MFSFPGALPFARHLRASLSLDRVGSWSSSTIVGRDLIAFNADSVTWFSLE
jgi:hypothetical protein